MYHKRFNVCDSVVWKCFKNAKMIVSSFSMQVLNVATVCTFLHLITILCSTKKKITHKVNGIKEL